MIRLFSPSVENFDLLVLNAELDVKLQIFFLFCVVYAHGQLYGLCKGPHSLSAIRSDGFVCFSQLTSGKYKLVERPGESHDHKNNLNRSGLKRDNTRQLRVETIANSAGGTAQVAIVAQPSTGFLNGRFYADKSPTEDTEDCLGRITVGLTRSKSLTILVSPLDMLGLMGMAQVVATIAYGIRGLRRGDTTWEWPDFHSDPTQENQGKSLDGHSTKRLTGPTHLWPLPISTRTGIQRKSKGRDIASSWYEAMTSTGWERGSCGKQEKD